MSRPRNNPRFTSKPEESGKRKDRWDIADIFAKWFGVIGVGLLGVWFTHIQKNRETNVRMVEMAINILKAKPDETSQPLREWSIKVLNEYSSIKLSKEAQEILRNHPLPGRFLADAEGNPILDERGNLIQPD